MLVVHLKKLPIPNHLPGVSMVIVSLMVHLTSPNSPTIKKIVDIN